MVQAAAIAYPQAEFEEADAERLPFDDASFDFVTCAFGLLHFDRPERAVAEARRVLKRGGRYTFCVWQPPDGQGGFFQLTLGAIERHGTTDVSLPPAPPFFRFADPLECSRVLTAAGFAEPTSRVVDLRLHIGRADELPAFIRRGTVRMILILDRQSDAARDRIERAIVDGAAAYRTANGIELRMPAVVTTAVVP
jgi:SAM-dependent methyltransferase